MVTSICDLAATAQTRTTLNLRKGQRVILFDGECNLCNGFVNYVIDKDLDNKYLFASLQAASGQYIQRELGLDATTMDSIILYDPEKVRYFHKSTAALYIIISFGGLWRLSGLLLLLPKVVRDHVYNAVARNRYRWFGRSACRIPTPELRNKFLP